MWKQIKNIIAVLLVAAFIASLYLNVRFCMMRRESIAVSDTTRVTIFDTIPYPMPVPKDSLVIRYITEKLPVSTETENFSTKNSDFSTGNGNIAQENITGNGNISSDNIPDSIAVDIPITQKVYEDSMYRAYVSGYRPSLDSLIIFPRHDITTVTNGYTYPKSRQKRWGIGIHVGYGMTMGRTPQFTPYIGFGISYNLITF